METNPPASADSPKPGTEEDRYRQKFLDLKAKSEDLEKGNDALHVKLQKAQREIYRLKVEKGFLFQKLDELIRSSEKQQAGSEEDSEEDAKEEEFRPAPKKRKAADAPAGPPAPKKPGNAFVIYCRKQRELGIVPEKGGPGGLGEATTFYSKMWGALSDQEKQPYVDLFEEEKRTYQHEVERYIEQYGVDPTQKKPKKPKGGGESPQEFSEDEAGNLSYSGAKKKKKKPAKPRARPAKPSGVVPQGFAPSLGSAAPTDAYSESSGRIGSRMDVSVPQHAGSSSSALGSAAPSPIALGYDLRAFESPSMDVDENDVESSVLEEEPEETEEDELEE
ncbi:hypothetical protein DFJ74DRAFT_661920 [Hyaloraphidium curvatum]|nr:hypothetical protein DFJ74DRAFT_661920 [Hyaloraphidium curvatum]